MRAHSILAAFLLLGLPFAALAQAPMPAKPAMPSNHPPIGGSPEPPSPWAELADYTLTVKVPPKGETGTWKFRTFANPADVIVDLDTPGPKGRTKGSIMLVGGKAIAIRGYAPEAGYEVDALDVAILNLKILTQLLDAAVPAGPAALKGKRAVGVREDKRPIVASTPSSTARFGAPWSLKGTVERVDAGTIAFRLELDVPGGDKPADHAKWSFAGTASGSTKDRVLADSMILEGWAAWDLTPASSPKQKSHTALKFGATRLPGPYATLKDLRGALK